MSDIAFLLKSLCFLFFLVRFLVLFIIFQNFLKFFLDFFQTNSLTILFFYLQMFPGILYNHLSILRAYDDQIGMFC
jgi:hypothetical protein